MEKDNLEILLEDIRGKFDLVLEGHDVLRKEIRDTRQELCEKIKFVDFKVDVISKELKDTNKELKETSKELKNTRKELSEKIDAVAVDLKEHRADTEVHKKVYKIKED